jgi:hypothetical protein
MVIPGSSAVVLAGIFTTFAQGWPLFGFLQHGASNWVFVSLVLFLTIIPIIIFIFLPRGKVFQAALDRAAVEKAVTAELKAAFRDPVVRAAHYYELGVIVVIIWLMVVKPF